MIATTITKTTTMLAPIRIISTSLLPPLPPSSSSEPGSITPTMPTEHKKMAAAATATAATSISSQKRQRCARVSIQPKGRVAYIRATSEIPQNEKDEMWYGASELAGFKQSARDLLLRNRRRRHGQSSSTASGGESESESSETTPQSPTASDSDSENENGNENGNGNENNNNNINHNNKESREKDSLRGMEAYVPSRQRFSKRFIEHVLEAYHERRYSHEHVALLAEKWSQKTRLRALAIAEEDYCIVYCSDEEEGEGKDDHKESSGQQSQLVEV